MFVDILSLSCFSFFLIVLFFHVLGVEEARKRDCHASVCHSAGISFVPLVVETFGGWSSEEVEILPAPSHQAVEGKRTHVGYKRPCSVTVCGQCIIIIIISNSFLASIANPFVSLVYCVALTVYEKIIIIIIIIIKKQDRRKILIKFLYNMIITIPKSTNVAVKVSLSFLDVPRTEVAFPI